MSLVHEKMGCSIKIDDGKMLPQYLVAQKFISSSGLFSKEELSPLDHYEGEPIRNFNKLVTGEIKVRDDVFESFSIA